MSGETLLFPGIERLDRDLTIGQMQGRFMMQVLPPSGHAVQENKPEKLSTNFHHSSLKQANCVP
ncbi:Protein phosphatase methylesterase 1 [Liparis tanakae]|uniref:Protein phosphatase methylesterase 1 n=1 Tax=Liparis tanakae TaxID=230148 RepID=A0A4Z2ETC0_9TELE|nr:Protein phosphatase methylesterase 1 [Liparis tanakae]